MESTESGSSPSWTGHLVRKEKQRRRETSSSHSKLHALKPITVLENNDTGERKHPGPILPSCPGARALLAEPRHLGFCVPEAERPGCPASRLTASQLAGPRGAFLTDGIFLCARSLLHQMLRVPASYQQGVRQVNSSSRRLHHEYHSMIILV